MQKDKYQGELLNFGSFLLFLGIEFFAALMIVRHEAFASFAVTILAFWIFYEMFFLIKVKKKQYSKASSNKPFLLTVSIIGSGTSAGKLIARAENFDFALEVAIIVSSIIIVYSLGVFQKFFILKFIKHHS